MPCSLTRQTGVGLCSMSARLGGIISPLIALLSTYNSVIPMAIFGSTPVIGGILCCLLPETRGKELRDGTEEPMENQWWVLAVYPQSLLSPSCFALLINGDSFLASLFSVIQGTPRPDM